MYRVRPRTGPLTDCLAGGLLPRGRTGGIVGLMPSRPSGDTSSDRFSGQRTAKPLDRPSPAQGNAKTNSTTLPRYFLPKDLAGALRRLDDVEIDALLAAVGTEAERRGRPPKPAKQTPVADAESQSRQASIEGVTGSLTTGKLNAVRAAFKAGVKPSAIARQFGISQADVRKALATEGRERKSGR
jgi:hypothetical protein